MKDITIYYNKNSCFVKNNNFKFDEEDKKLNELFRELNFKYDYKTTFWIGKRQELQKIKTALLMNNANLNEKKLEEYYITKKYTLEEIQDFMKSLEGRISGYLYKEYQSVAVHFLVNRKFSILGDMLGIGKTVELTVAMKFLHEKEGLNKFLIVTLAGNLVVDFTETINKFFGEEKAKEMFTITNYEQFRSKNLEALINKTYDIVVCDESSVLRNSTQARKGLMKVKSKIYWMSSGEVLEKYPLDLFYVVNTFTSIFDYDKFSSSYVVFKTVFLGKKRVKKPVMFKNLNELKSEIEPYFIKRDREDISELKKIDIVSNDIIVETNTEQDIKLNELQKEMVIQNKIGLNDNMILGLFQKTRLILDDANYEEPNLPIKSNKYLKLKELIEKNKGKKLVIFTAYKIVLEKLHKELEKDGIKTILISSSMKNNERSEQIKKYKASTETNILIASDILAYGVNLETTSVMIHYDLPLLASKIKQRTYRMVRQTSTHDKVESYTLLTNTEFDKAIKRIIMKKLAYSTALAGNLDSSIKIGVNFSKDEMKETVMKLL